VEPGRTICIVGPHEVFNPHIRFPFICTGSITPGTPFVQLLYRIYEILTFWPCRYKLDHPFNLDAAEWVRRNPDRVPTDRRPLRRRRLDLYIETVEPDPGVSPR
jgi:hypothetical protein